MDAGILFEGGFNVYALSGESFVIEAYSPTSTTQNADTPPPVAARYAFTNIDDLMAFLINEKDAFDNRKATAP